MVLSKFIELAEKKVTEAQEKSEELLSTSTTANIEDLEAIETPESILLSTVSGEQSRDRTDRAIVTPWLKFLWETYRTVLDILKNNARLETLYQSTAHQAFQFCTKYTRKTEFRRLCELLRNHLQNAAKYQSQIHAINLSDPDTLQRHLDTRFQQLNVAVELELWQEAFRSIEDIHTLLNLSKRPAKPIMMSNYFQKLSTIFLVGENYLFHSAALNRYYNLLRSSAAVVASGQTSKKDHPTVTDADLAKNASFVVLSALAIPVISTTRSRGAMADVDEARKNKNQRLTNLLALQGQPTRSSIFKDIQAKGLLKRARPEIRELYNILEVDFHPLSICQKISPILAQVGADPEMGKYVLPLQQVILTRLFQQLTQVYESVDLKFVLDLAQFPEPFNVEKATIEKFIMNGCKKGDLGIRIDHATGVLTFDSDVFSSAKAMHPGAGAGSAEADASSVQRLQSTPAEIVRTQLTRLAKTLFVTCQYVDPTFSEDQRKNRAAALQRAEVGAEKEHLDTLARKEVIEKKKVAAVQAAAQKKKDEETRSKIKAQELEQAEQRRIADQNRERDQRRMKQEQQKVQQEEVAKQLKELQEGKVKVDVSSLDISELDSQRIRAMKIQALEKEKTDLTERLRVTGKRNDHLERAFRKEEIKHLPEDYARQRETDLAEYEASKTQTLRESEEKHAEAVELKGRLSRLVDSYGDFRDKVRTERQASFEKNRRDAERELQKKKDARVKEFRDRKIRERKEAADAERAAREEEERVQREAEEKAKADEEKRAKAAEEKAKRDEDRKYVKSIQIRCELLLTTSRRLDEQSARQRQREAEVEERMAAKKQGRAMPERPAAPTMERTESSGDTAPPRAGMGKSAGGWREREAARLAGQTTQIPAEQPPAASTEDAPPPTKGSGYVPPHLRKGVPPREGGESPSDGWRSASRGRDENTSRAPSSRFAAPPRDSTESPANGDGSQRTESPAAPPPAGGPGKYRPGMFKQNRG